MEIRDHPLEIGTHFAEMRIKIDPPWFRVLTGFLKSATMLRVRSDLGGLNLETQELIAELKKSIEEIPALKEIEEGFQNPHIKAWKTKVADLLGQGGTTCRDPLEIIKKMRSQMGSTQFVVRHSFLNQFDALERSIKQTIHTIEVFGRPEEKDILPHWGKPKSQQRALGNLMVGAEEVATDNISIHEVLDCLVSLCEDSDDLSSEMRTKVITHLNAILDDDMLQPFLTRKLDVLLGHWPEFQNK